MWLVTQSLPQHRGGGGSRPWGFVPGSWLPAQCPCGTGASRPVPPPWALSLCGFIGVFFKVCLICLLLPKPCPCPCVGLNKQSLNTPVCVGGVDAHWVCGPPCLSMSPALGLRRKKGLPLFPEPLPIQELGSGSGCPLWGFWRARTAPFHSCRDLNLSCGRTRVGRSSEQLNPSSLHHSPTLMGASWVPRACHCTKVAPHPSCHQHLPRAASLPGVGLWGWGCSLPFPIPVSSLPCSHFPRSLGYLPCPHCLPRARLAHEHCASAKPRMPQEETSLLPLPVLPPPLRQAVPECERKLLRR